uniref:Uncharacterized protein n=1 Tax=Arundo donax TaxID=35708 RepID=A0A0A9D5V0_ARUDO
MRATSCSRHASSRAVRSASHRSSVSRNARCIASCFAVTCLIIPSKSATIFLSHPPPSSSPSSSSWSNSSSDSDPDPDMDEKLGSGRLAPGGAGGVVHAIVANG